MTQIWVGIDPGQSGAVGAIFEDGHAEAWQTPVIQIKTATGKKTKTTTMYDEPGMIRVLETFVNLRKEGIQVMVALEEVSAMGPGVRGRVQGVSSTFKLGMGYGMWRGILATLKLPYELIRPTRWKPPMVGTGADKEKSRLLCLRLYPELALPLKKDADKAEAVMIAEYLKRRTTGQSFTSLPTQKEPPVETAKQPPRARKKPSDLWRA